MVKPLLIVALLVGAGVARADTTAAAPADERALRDAARAVVRALDAHDFVALAALVDQRGLRFAAYRCGDDDVTVAHDDIGTLLDDARVRRWGTYDGSGEPIRLRFSRYFARFVYDRRFAEQPPEVLPRREPPCVHTPGPSRAVRFRVDTDTVWRALYLVFTPSAAGWRLVRIVHDEWTI